MRWERKKNGGPPSSGGDILGLCRHMDQNISTGVDGGLIGDTGARTLLEIDKQQNKIGSHTKLYFEVVYLEAQKVGFKL